MNQNPEAAAKPVAAPAAVGWRLLALTYDCLPMIPLLMISSAAFLWLNGGRTVEKRPALAALELLMIWLLVGAYFVASWRRGGQTVGMRPWRLLVLAADGKPASVRALCLRYLVACLTPIVCLAWCTIDAERRGLHDIAGKTIFVRLQRQPED
ncbi:MAG: RDD family protein [Arenimonas sp.]